jgi:hypothetical protein
MNILELCASVLMAAAAFEAVTLFFRFGLGLQATRDTRRLARWTRGVRIHHGYVGLVALGPFAVAPVDPLVADVGIVISGALILSDLIHHFLVLWPLTGSPQFDLTYDPVPPPARQSAASSAGLPSRKNLSQDL